MWMYLSVCQVEWRQASTWEQLQSKLTGQGAAADEAVQDAPCLHWVPFEEVCVSTAPWRDVWDSATQEALNDAEATARVISRTKAQTKVEQNGGKIVSSGSCGRRFVDHKGSA